MDLDKCKICFNNTKICFRRRILERRKQAQHNPTTGKAITNYCLSDVLVVLSLCFLFYRCTLSPFSDSVEIFPSRVSFHSKLFFSLPLSKIYVFRLLYCNAITSMHVVCSAHQRKISYPSNSVVVVCALHGYKRSTQFVYKTASSHLHFTVAQRLFPFSCEYVCLRLKNLALFFILVFSLNSIQYCNTSGWGRGGGKRLAGRLVFLFLFSHCKKSHFFQGSISSC